MTMPLNAGRGRTSVWRGLAGRVASGAGRARMNAVNRIKARIPGAVILVNRIRIRALDAIRGIHIASRKNTYWWKLVLATMGAAGAGWVLGGAAWSVGLGLATPILGGLNLIRMMHKSRAGNLPDADAGKSKFAIAIWSRQNARAILLAVAPSLLIVVLLWAAVPSALQYPEPVAVAETPQSANDKPNAGGRVTKPTSLRHDAEARANLKKAKKMLAEKNYADAIRLSQEVLKKYPRSRLALAILKEASAGQKHKGLFW